MPNTERIQRWIEALKTEPLAVGDYYDESRGCYCSLGLGAKLAGHTGPYHPSRVHPLVEDYYGLATGQTLDIEYLNNYGSLPDFSEDDDYEQLEEADRASVVNYLEGLLAEAVSE